MSAICPFCGSETGGVDPCPKCGGALGVVPSGPEARFVEVRRQFDWRPWFLTLVVLLMLVGIAVYRNRPHAFIPSQTVAKAPVKAKRGKIASSPMISLPPRSNDEVDMVDDAAQLDDTPAPKPTETAPAPTTGPETAEVARPPDNTEDSQIVDQPSDLVRIGEIAVDTEQDDSGDTFAVGHMMIVNTGVDEISTFNITMETGDGVFTLVPFEGTIDNPQTITDRRIPPGGYLDVPVMSQGIFQTANAHGPKVVTLSATEGGLLASDRMTIQ
jgi:hypothetical protein